MTEIARVLSQPHCTGCIGAEKLLAKLKVPFEVINVQEDAEAAQEVADYCTAVGVRPHTPVIVYGDEVIIGFQYDKIKALVKE